MPHVRALIDGRGVAFEVESLVDYKMFSLNIFECLVPRVLFKFDQIKPVHFSVEAQEEGKFKLAEM